MPARTCLSQHRPQVLLIEDRFPVGVKLIQVDVVGPQGPERILHLCENAARTPVIGAQQVTVEVMAELSPPNCRVPRPMTDTLRSVFPSLLYYIYNLFRPTTTRCPRAVLDRRRGARTPGRRPESQKSAHPAGRTDQVRAAPPPAGIRLRKACAATPPGTRHRPPPCRQRVRADLAHVLVHDGSTRSPHRRPV